MNELSKWELFWARVLVGDKDKCWDWLGPRNPHPRDNYGSFQFGGKNYRAHRVAYELTKGPIPDGLVVCHKCDRPPCCNPIHLFVGTRKQNMEDCKAKKRYAHGIQHGLAVLNDKLVMQIRRTYARGTTSMMKLARKFNVSGSCVCNIINGKRWSHLPLVPMRPKVLHQPEVCSAPDHGINSCDPVPAFLGQSCAESVCSLVPSNAG